MDEVYVNTEEVLGCRRKSKREHKTVDIYMINEGIQTVQRETTGPAHPGSEDVKKRTCRAAVILLGLLCLLLLIGLITLVFLFTQGKSQWVMDTVMNNVTSKRNQLQTSFNNLVKERDQLQKRLEDLTTNRDDLQRKLQYCKENWVYFSDSLYQVSSEQKSWEESRQDCLQKGSDLVIINSREEQNFVNQFKRLLWIGLTDSETEGTWKWVDGTQVNTSYWNSGESNGGRGENCGQIKAYDSQNSWNDETCSNQHFWICKKRVSP
ncbi:unnamed protein product [Oreochromis niloticus]|nr:unnamed protein product [Mustela putorius furo]